MRFRAKTQLFVMARGAWRSHQATWCHVHCSAKLGKWLEVQPSLGVTSPDWAQLQDQACSVSRLSIENSAGSTARPTWLDICAARRASARNARTSTSSAASCAACSASRASFFAAAASSSFAHVCLFPCVSAPALPPLVVTARSRSLAAPPPPLVLGFGSSLETHCIPSASRSLRCSICPSAACACSCHA